MTRQALEALDRRLTEVLGPPTFRERLINDTMAALRSYDYADAEDEVDYTARRAEACHVLALVGGNLVELGRERAARETIPDHLLRDWDALAGCLRDRDGWRVVFDDARPWWAFHAPPGTHVDDALTIGVGRFSEPGGPRRPYLASPPDVHSDASLFLLDGLLAALPGLEAEADRA